MKKLLLSIIIPVTVTLTVTTSALAAPPANFSTTQIIGSGLTEPTGFAFAPDGRIFITQRSGGVKIYKAGVLQPANFVVLPAATNGDRGLVGIAFDPNWNTNHYVYFYYSDSADSHNYLVRYNSAADTATDGPTIIFETPDQSFQLHVGGGLAFGPDGKIYLSVGDNGSASNSQNLGNIYGKILRLNPDGTVPADNPYVSQSGKNPYIWAAGLRNPFRMQFDSASGRLYIGDVGQSTWEEINIGARGGNFGWPNCEGFCSPANSSFIDPTYAYNHNGASMSVTGGPVYHGSMFPTSYQGRYFFGDYAAGFIKTLTLDGSGKSTGVSNFDTSVGSVVDMRTAPDGSLYYITIVPGRLYRVSYSTTNPPPVAVASADVTTGNNPLTVHFSSAGSFDPNANPLTYSWDFGDASTSSSANPTHIFNNQGTYTVQLTVSDGTTPAQAIPITIQVGTPPELSIDSPQDGSNYKAGDTVHYSATSTNNTISTTVLFHHGTHIHPFLGPVEGASGDIGIPTTGESSSDTWYEIQITATDSNGLSTTRSVNIYPQKTEVTFTTNPASLQISLNDIPQTAPVTIQSVVNFQWLLAAPTQTFNGQIYQFDSWSDGGTATHTISAPSSPTTYTANFVSAPPPTNAFLGEYFTNLSLSGSPALSRIDSSINFDWGMNPPDPSMPVDNFSVRWTSNPVFSAGTYIFSTTADDGVRLKIDGVTVIDKWIDQSATTYTTNITLNAGNHVITLEYYDSGWDAVAKLSWTSSSSPTPTPTPTPPVPSPGSFTGLYFSNKTLSGSPALTRTDSGINFNWGTASPGAPIPADNFSVRWTGSPTFLAGTYRFTTTADDGVRLKIDGVTVIDKWLDQSATTYTTDVLLTAGSHTIIMEYYDSGWDAVAKLSWSQLTVTSFTGQYYSNKTLSGSPALTRTDSGINFNWGTASPAPSLPANNFSVRWTASPVFSAGTYIFSVTADDGVRLKIDGVIVIDKWINQSATTYTASKLLTTGSHTVVMEYYENSGYAVAKLSWL